jgi:hypothetical protein
MKSSGGVDSSPLLSDREAAIRSDPKMLVGWVINIEGIGIAEVVRTKKKLGGTTKHIVRLPGQQSKMIIVELERHNNGKKKFELVRTAQDMGPTLVATNCLPPMRNKGKGKGKDKQRAQPHVGMHQQTNSGALQYNDDRNLLLGGRGRKDDDEEEKNEEDELEQTPYVPHNIGYGDRNIYQQALNETEKAKDAMHGVIQEKLKGQAKTAALIQKAETMRRRSLVFREAAVLARKRQRLKGCSGPCRAIQQQHDVIGICCVDADDPYSCGRRVLYLLLTLCLTLGMTFAVRVWSTGENGWFNENSECNDPYSMCRVIIVAAICTPIKYFMLVVLRDVIPHPKGERSLLRAAQQWNRGWRVVCRWSCGLLWIFALSGGGFFILIYGVLVADRDLTGDGELDPDGVETEVETIEQVFFTFMLAFLVGQAYNFVIIVLYYWIVSRGCGSYDDPETAGLDAAMEQLYQDGDCAPEERGGEGDIFMEADEDQTELQRRAAERRARLRGGADGGNANGGGGSGSGALGVGGGGSAAADALV